MIYFQGLGEYLVGDFIVRICQIDAKMLVDIEYLPSSDPFLCCAVIFDFIEAIKPPHAEALCVSPAKVATPIISKFEHISPPNGPVNHIIPHFKKRIHVHLLPIRIVLIQTSPRLKIASAHGSKHSSYKMMYSQHHIWL